MQTKILLTGKNGQLGWELEKLLPQVGQTIALGRHELDLTDVDEIRSTLRELRPNLIVNAAAYTAVDQAESNPEIAHAINSKALCVIAEEAKKLNAAVLHYSTDYVFDGSKKAPYEETDLPHPLNVYGATKLGGEQAIQHADVAYFIFRTEWVYTTRGKNFLLTILRLATQKQELRVVDDQIGAPTSSGEIALATTRILKQLYSPTMDPSRLAESSGVYHLTAVGQTTWCGFAKAILEECAQLEEKRDPWLASVTENRPFICERVLPITTTSYAATARRPPFSLLSNAKLRRAFGIELPDWRSQLRAAFRQATTTNASHALLSGS